MKDVVSIIIPCYNYGDVVKKAVKSALSQSYPNIDIVVVDDGSTDETTIEALEEIKRGKAKVIRQANGGLAAARNIGVQYARGEYLFFLDNDDTIHPRTIEILLNIIKTHPEYAYVYSEVFYYGNIPEYFVWKPQEFNLYNLIWANHPTLSSLIRREAHIKVGGFSENFIYGWEDWEYWLKLSKHGYYGKLVEIPLYYYWRHGNTMAHAAKEKAGYSINKLISNNPEIYNTQYISEIKKRWRPIVTVILFDDGNILEYLPVLFEQTITDKQIIVLTPDKQKVAAFVKAHEVKVIIIETASDDQFAEKNFNKAFNKALGEFTFLLKNSTLSGKTNLEEAIWRKIFDKQSPYHYYFSEKGVTKKKLIIPDDISMISGLLIETSLLRFSGGFDPALEYEEGFMDLIARLFVAKIEGTGIAGNILRSFADTDPAEKDFDYYSHLYGLSADLSLLNRDPLRKEQEVYESSQNSYLDHKLRQEVLADFSFPYYADNRNQRLNFPAIINPDNSEKNILFMVPYMVPGGAEKVDLDILQGLKRDGFRVTLVSEKPADHKWKDQYLEYVNEIFELDHLTDEYRYKIKFLEYIVISRNISLLFIRSSAIGYMFAKELNKDLRSEIAVIDLLHAYNRFHEDWIDFSTPYDEYLDERIVITNDLKNYLVSKYKISKNKINIIYNGVDAKLFNNDKHKGKLRNKLKLDQGTRIIGFVGRLVDDKDPIKWIEVAAELNKLTRNVHFVMFGNGDMEEEVAMKIRELQIKNITLAGWHDRLHEMLPDMDVLMMTSKNEGFPLVIMEALCSGVHVIAPQVGGISEIINNDFNELVDPDAGTAPYVNALVRILLMSDHQKKYLLAETRKFIRNEFNISVCQKNYCDKLNSLVSSLNHKKRKTIVIKTLIAEEFITEDYRINQEIYYYKNLQAYYLAEIHRASHPYQKASFVPAVQLGAIAGNMERNEIFNRDIQIAEWYHHQYEVLPLWYKRFGHIIKVIYGKRTFRSLFVNKGKEQAENMSVQQWYDKEYEVLPLWYKRFGHIIKVFMGKRSFKSLISDKTKQQPDLSPSRW